MTPLDEAVRKRVRWSHGAVADWLSDAAATLVPLACVGSRGWARPSAYRVARAVSLVAVVNQISKAVAMRERPFARGKPTRKVFPDRYGSFFSGHASATAAACGAAVLDSVRAGEPPIRWLPLCLLPPITGYLRMAADRHYFTDVAAGIGIGAAVGAAVVLLAPNEPPVEIAEAAIAAQTLSSP